MRLKAHEEVYLALVALVDSSGTAGNQDGRQGEQRGRRWRGSHPSFEIFPNPFSLRIEISLTDCPSLACHWKTPVSRVRSLSHVSGAFASSPPDAERNVVAGDETISWNDRPTLQTSPCTSTTPQSQKVKVSEIEPAVVRQAENQWDLAESWAKQGLGWKSPPQP